MVESLEGKLLLSTARASVRQAPQVAIDGTYKSSVNTLSSTGTTIVTITQPFSGQSRGLGRANGTLVEKGNTSTGEVLESGFLISAPKGTIHLVFDKNSLVSHKVTKTTSTEVLKYSVDYGTGAYTTAKGAGTLNLTYTIKTGDVKLTVKPGK
jgi:hypothetical protein